MIFSIRPSYSSVSPAFSRCPTEDVGLVPSSRQRTFAVSHRKNAKFDDAWLLEVPLPGAYLAAVGPIAAVETVIASNATGFFCV